MSVAGRFGRGVAALWRRELIRFLRQPSRIASAAGSPLLFWLVLGAGLGSSFRLPGGVAPEVSFRVYFFPGTLVLLVLFSAIFSTISVIEERQGGFLQGVLVSPIPTSALVLGKVLGGASLAWAQGAVLLVLAPWAGMPIGLAQGAAALGVLAAIAVGLTALGFAFAWRLDSTQGFHGVMNLLLVPMWLLSGAFFPLQEVPPWLAAIAWANPMTYAMGAFRRLLQPGVGSVADPFGSLGLPLAVTAGFTALALVAAVATVASGRRG